MGGSRRAWWISGLVSLVAVLCAGSMLFRNWYVDYRGDQEQAKLEQWSREQSQMASWPDAQKVLTAQASALTSGDQQRWLAAVDASQPQLQAYYRNLFTTLRALRVTGWIYHPDINPVMSFGHSTISVSLTTTYCFSTLSCPKTEPLDDPLHLELATIHQMIKLDKRDGRYVIVEVKQDGKQPPWQRGDLSVAAGSRVVVAAPADQASRLKDVVAAADKAADEADAFARYTGAKPARYRVYLAGDTDWKSWYGGDAPSWADGYTMPTGRTGMDVVLRMSELDRPQQLAKTLRHEFGHVVTLSGTDLSGDMVFSLNEWLEEGVAEYIAQTPRTALASGRVAPLRRAGTVPDDMRIPPLSDTASPAEVDRLYGYGYLAVRCMATTYGQAKMMTFVNGVLRRKDPTDAAARRAFGVPFATVNRTCTGYFRTLVR